MDNIIKNKEYEIFEALNKADIQDYKIIGNSKITISYPSTIWIGKKGSISFCSPNKVDDEINVINNSQSSVVILHKDIPVSKINTQNKTIILVSNPREVFIKILNSCFPLSKKQGEINTSAIIEKGAEIHKSVYIGPYCVIGKCKIDKETVIHPNVIINDNVKIGKNVTIFPGCVIGYDGFGYNRNKDGTIEKFPHYGGVLIEDDVEIGSNVSIDRGTLGDTIIKKGVKIDNFSHIAHNVIIGKYSLIIAHTMLGGSTKIGDYSWIAPSVAIREGIKIGDKSLVGLGAVVTKDVPDNAVVVGNPAQDLNIFKNRQKKLKELLKD